jgi:hypothetical protein
MDRRDRLAELLTDDDVETLKHLAREGIARVGSRLFGDLGGRRHRPAVAAAGDRGGDIEIRGVARG